MCFSWYILANAYSKTLRKYHGWMVRGVFAVGPIIVESFYNQPIISVAFKRFILRRDIY